MDAFVIAVAGLLGLAFGSFGNVVVHRVPRGDSVVRPRSACPGCSTPIAPRDNVPVVSWLVLRGRCRTCSTPISIRYPALEVLMAAAFALTAATAPRWSDLVLTLPLVFSFVCLAAIDLEHHRLPDRLTLPSIAIGIPLAFVAAWIAGDWWLAGRAILVAAAAFAIFAVIALAVPAGFGLGDVKLAPSLGLVLGFAERGAARGFTGFLGAFILGSVVGVALMAIGRAGRKTALPFGPFLVLATLIVLWTGDALVRPWLGE